MHRRRPTITKNTPVHVTLRVRKHVWNLRTKRCYRVIHRCLAAGGSQTGFRLVHYSVQGNHLHLIIEATNKVRLSRGMQGLCTRLARRLNHLMQRKGSLFEDRYYEHVLRCPREIRCALAYVLNNHRRHGRNKGDAHKRGAFPDLFSSGFVFDGWRKKPPLVLGETSAGKWLEELSPPVVPAHSWALSKGWRRHRLIDLLEVPGPRSAPESHRAPAVGTARHRQQLA